MRIAFVKQDVYQDLYVGGRRDAPEALLFSSIMRVGPLGLFTLCQADFIIVQEVDTPETRAWEKIIPHYPPAWFRELKDKPFLDTPFPEAKFLKPEGNRPHRDFSVDPEAVDWGAYDVVVSINFGLPTDLIKRYPKVLWCYMVGEANVFCDRVYFGYDVCLNQEIRGIVSPGLGIIDFPYTFLGARCLEDLMAGVVGRPSRRRGIFAEINSFTERPVTSAGHLRPLEATGHEILLHQQKIRDNLTCLYDSKYFVKIGGRKIRGNSVLEAISCGSVVLMNPAELHHSQLLPREAWVHSLAEAREKIDFLDAHPVAYEALKASQRFLLQTLAVDMPMESLRNALHTKRTAPTPLRTPSPRPSVLRSGLRALKNRLRRALD